jgi:energy-coupling factor transport system permease protein
VSAGSFLKRAKHGIKILSILMTWALENAIDTADSMKARGYGLPGRTAFSVYSFERRDKYAMLFMLLCGGAEAAGIASGKLGFTYFPSISSLNTDAVQLALFAVYSVLCAMPMIINIKEDVKWSRQTKARLAQTA